MYLSTHIYEIFKLCSVYVGNLKKKKIKELKKRDDVGIVPYERCYFVTHLSNYFIGKEMNMPNLTVTTANIRLTNEDKKVVCSMNNISPSVTADTAAAFADAIEKLYNNGPCTARMSIAYDIVR